MILQDEVLYTDKLGYGYEMCAVKTGHASADIMLKRDDGCIVWSQSVSMQGPEPTDAEIDEWVDMATTQMEVCRA